MLSLPVTEFVKRRTVAGSGSAAEVAATAAGFELKSVAADLATGAQSANNNNNAIYMYVTRECIMIAASLACGITL